MSRHDSDSESRINFRFAARSPANQAERMGNSSAEKMSPMENETFLCSASDTRSLYLISLLSEFKIVYRKCGN